MYVHWTEECNLCSKRGDCEYEEAFRIRRKMLADVDSAMQKHIGKCYGSLKYNCDYFKVDEEEYNRVYPGELESII